MEEPFQEIGSGHTNSNYGNHSSGSSDYSSDSMFSEDIVLDESFNNEERFEFKILLEWYPKINETDILEDMQQISRSNGENFVTAKEGAMFMADGNAQMKEGEHVKIHAWNLMFLMVGSWRFQKTF